MNENREIPKEDSQDNRSIPGLGPWNLYFLFKFLLYWKEYIDLNALQNLGFAAFLLIPLKPRLLKILRQLIAIPLGITIFYTDSFLPPFHRLLSESTLIGSFNAVYLLELAGRFINLDIIALLFILLTTYIFAQRFIRISVLVVATLIILNLPLGAWFGGESEINQASLKSSNTDVGEKAPGNSESDLNLYLEQFYASELKRTMSFTPPAETDVPFDLIFINVCSLSWDDLAHSKLENELPQFDIMLDSFNSAASYSGPAIIRMLRSSCGQSSHNGLYSPAKENCFLFENLAKIGFEKEIVLNHDGHFDDFLSLVQQQGLQTEPLSIEGLRVPLKAFDGSPVYGDLSVLKRWLDRRQKNQAPRSAVFYNTVTMHDGNRFVDNRSRMSSTANFSLRLKGMLSELKTFFNILEKSGRRIIVVMLPEHGAAVRGDKMQISGLREIPSPQITLGPAAIRLIGPEYDIPMNPIRISEQTSYLDLMKIVAEIMGKNPFGKEGVDLETISAKIDGTTFVSENAGTVVLRHQDKYYMRQGESKKWIEYQRTE